MTPRDLPAVHRLLGAAYRNGQAPIIELIQAETSDPFKVLVGTILSSRTQDATTAAACHRLFALAPTAEALERLPTTAIEKAIYPVGFYRVKAVHLKALPAALRERFEGRIPQSVEELCELPGVGRKTANLVVSVAFDHPAICVDVHVHRIGNRLGLLTTRTPLESEMTLRRILPKRYWKTWNRYLVSYGQTVCRPIHPKCPACAIAPYCARVGV